MKLTEREIGGKLAQAAGWMREDEKWIVKKYRFPAFMTGVRFVNEVAAIAEQMNHHPLIAIDYKVVTLRLTSWKHAGLTELDFQSADRYDRAFDSLEQDGAI